MHPPELTPIAWKHISDRANESWREIHLSNPDGSLGVRLSLDCYPTCYRRGPWKLLVEVLDGPFHHAWGCFDEADQPVRWYHDEAAALAEGVRIARVLVKDFKPVSRT